jgi:nucleoid-associated protein EbfC
MKREKAAIGGRSRLFQRSIINMFKGLSNLASLLRQAQQIGGQMGQLTEKMKNQRVTGSAGGGMVEIEVNGLMEVLRCHIDPQLFTQGDREMLEDLVLAAVNQAIAKGKQMHADTMRELTGGISLPGLQEALQKFTGTEEEKKDE